MPPSPVKSYILNGVKTQRLFHPGVRYTANHDLQNCDPPVCTLITRPYYVLCENGDIYVVSPDMRVWYLAAFSDTMRCVFPLNDRVLAEVTAPDITGLSGDGSSDTSITITWDNPNGKGVTWEQIIMPSHGNPIPWSPGMIDCSARCPSDDVVDYGMGTLLKSKEPIVMRLPYVNGYFCIQDAEDHGVVFYHGELIYNGKYSANGYTLKFAYGDEYCPFAAMCCPMETTTTWEYQSFPKWKKSESGQLLAMSGWDKILAAASVDDEGNEKPPPNREPSDSERSKGTIVEACEHEIEFVMHQTIIMESCEGGGGAVRRKEWYFGGAGDVKEVVCSKWKEEYCRVTMTGTGGMQDDLINEMQGGVSCNDCPDPENKQSGENDPVWKHVPEEKCKPSPAQEEEGMHMDIRERCITDVAKIVPVTLGGRIFPVINSGGSISNWAYIYREQGLCRTRKDYTVIGSIKSIEELPGNIPNDSSTATNWDIIKNFTIHSPKDFFGDWWEEEYEYPDDYTGERLTKKYHNDRLRFTDGFGPDVGQEDNFEEIQLTPEPPAALAGRGGYWSMNNLTEDTVTWQWTDNANITLRREYFAPKPYAVDANNNPVLQEEAERWEFLEITGGGNSRKIKYRHKIMHWGDLRGPVIRKGIQTGDVFYYLGSENDDPEKRDKYWYWSGYKWSPGTVPYSQIGGQWADAPEIALFYKDTGHLNLAGEICAQAQALFIGKYHSLVACRNLLAVNLNAGADYRKVLFWDNKIIWERPASGNDFRDFDGNPMQEGVVCTGEYMLCVYNVGTHMQKLKIWMLDYTKDEDDQEATVMLQYENTFPYNRTPNIFKLQASNTHDERRDKYGQKAAKNYLILASVDEKSLYVWYRAEVKKVYEDGKFSPQYGTSGPIYAVVCGVPNDGCSGGDCATCCDVWYLGEIAVSTCATIMYDGAVLGLGGLGTIALDDKNTANHTNMLSISLSGYFVVSEGAAYSHAVGWRDSWSNGYWLSTGQTWGYTPVLISETSGDWVYFTIPESTVGDPVTYEDERGNTITKTDISAVLHIYRYNRITQELTAVQTTSTPLLGPENNDGCLTGPSSSYVKYCFGSSYGYEYSSVSDYSSGTSGKVMNMGGWHGYALTMTGHAPGITTVNVAFSDPATHFTHANNDQLILIPDQILVSEVAPNLCEVLDETPDDHTDNPYVAETQSGSYFIAGSSGAITKVDMECTKVWVQVGQQQGGGYWACGCDSIWESRCGRYITRTVNDLETETSTVHLFFDGKLTATGNLYRGCCANYAMMSEEGAVKLYYRTKSAVSSADGNSTFGSCCGDATIVNRGNSADLFIKGDRIWTKPRYGDNEAGEWNISCCGRDYFLVQRGTFKKEKNGYHIAERETSSTDGLCTTNRKTINKSASYGTLEDGTTAHLIEIAEMEWQTKPDPLSGTFSRYHVEYPKRWRATLHNKDGEGVEVEFDHDVQYTLQDENSSPMIKETRNKFIPWKYDYIDAGREAYVYYLTTEICKDPRVSKIECFREYDTGTVEGVIADACFAVFYDNPFLNVTKSYTFDKRSGGGDALAKQTSITEHFKYQPAVQDAMPVYKPDDYDFEGCTCLNRAMIDAAFPNIGLYVWVGKNCSSKCTHTGDTPRTPFYGVGDGVYDAFRKDILYISDYNCATRFDRASEYDPVDHTIHNDYPHGTDGTGGSWLAPPTHSNIPIDELNADDEDLVDLSGRLVTSGGNVLFVWDQAYGRLEFNIVTGARIERS